MASDFKPLWDVAPKGAQYLAMDQDKTWHFFSHQPTQGEVSWYATGPSGRRWAFHIGPSLTEWPDVYADRPWTESLEART